LPVIIIITFFLVSDVVLAKRLQL